MSNGNPYGSTEGLGNYFGDATDPNGPWAKQRLANLSGYGTQLGGFNNDANSTGPSLEQMQNQRLGALGTQQSAQQLQPWEQQGQGMMQGWANQSQQMLGNQYAQAQAQFNGGVTPQQQALAQQQGAQQGAVSSMAQAAGGGARGAAAAAGTGVAQMGQNVGLQAGQMAQQKLSDKYAAASQMTNIAQQQQGLAQGEYGVQAQQGINNANYQQGWQGQNDQNALWANTMQANQQAVDLGQQTQANQLAAQQQMFQAQQNQQAIGAGFSTAGAAMALGAKQQNNPNNGA